MVSGYNRNATIQHSEFAYVGGNAVAAWGYTNETATDPGRPGVEITNHPMAGASSVACAMQVLCPVSRLDSVG
jgi:hypothetical protein